MIVTVTPNPSVDRTIEVAALLRGTVIRATGSRVDPGGKGINVSRALAAHGMDTCAVLPSGGVEGSQLAGLLEPAGVDVVLVPVEGSVRSNISVVEPDGTTTKLNEPGPTLSPEEVEAVTQATVMAAAHASWIVVAGSLPPGAPVDLYARLVEAVRATHVRIAVDSSGPPFEAALRAAPDLVKPNREELADAAGQPVTTIGEAIKACRTLRDRGAGAVLASLGRDGALLVDGSGDPVLASAVVAEPNSTVGAGDATLAGFLAAGGQGEPALAEAVAWGAAAVSLPGSRMPAPLDLDRGAVVIDSDPDPDRLLED